MLSTILLFTLCLISPLRACRTDFPLAFVSQRSNKSRGAITRLRATSSTASSTGLYRPFCEHAFMKLEKSGLFVPSTDLPESLQGNVAPAKGMPEGSVVKMETKALVPSNEVVSYARYALLETIVTDYTEQVSAKGIQVMNLVVFPRIKRHCLSGVSILCRFQETSTCLPSMYSP